ncbi:MAG: single-stranded-DNA-specific exonuclease RecJ [Proteobacteria bacterium]|nr:single-stranded-DNA-specific exonuclease RecJ [Pseudomonadota bacterium]
MLTNPYIVRPIPESNLPGEVNLHPVCRRILAARNVQSMAETDYSLTKLLPPDAIRNLQEAAELLANCFLQDRSILIFGDYDVDGATSTALCIRAMALFGYQNTAYLMPDRFIDGYGLSTSSAQRIVELNPDCVITVDNGISSHDGISLLREHSIDVIVTDHHLPANELPNASVIVDQNAWPDEKQAKNLAGVGVAFYLMLALRKSLRETGWFNQQRVEPNLSCCLDLVAIGTVADLVPLDYNNRVLVNEGLRRIRKGLCAPGVKALIDIAKKQMDKLSSADIGFAIAPRINAAGRLDDMTTGVRCLLSDDETRARLLAGQLDEINRKRRDIQQQMSDEAQQQLASLKDQDLYPQGHLKDRCGIVLYQEGWHEGIVGIVAAKICEKYHRPSIVFARSDDDILKGSGRSIQGIHLRDMLDCVDKRYPGMILKFGGHAMAAGLSLVATSLDQFTEAFHRVIEEIADPSCFSAVIECDGELEQQYLSLDFAQELHNLGPWGQRFPVPSFVGEFQVLGQRVLGGQHLKLVLRPLNSPDEDITTLDAIAFFQPTSILNKPFDRIHIHFELNANRFRGEESLQLLIRDIF